jgi:hypothetical protein
MAVWLAEVAEVEKKKIVVRWAERWMLRGKPFPERRVERDSCSCSC